MKSRLVMSYYYLIACNANKKCRLLSIPASIQKKSKDRTINQRPTQQPCYICDILNCTHSLVLNCLMLVTFRPGYLFIKMIWLAKTQTMKWCKNLFSNNIYISFLCIYRYYVEFISIVSIVYSQPRNRLWLWYQY